MRTYRLKYIPGIIQEWFERYNALHPGTVLDQVYTYAGMRGKTYACVIYKDGHLFDNSCQRILEGYKTIDCYIIPAKII